MTTYLDTIARQFSGEINHAFVLHGNTRDLQLGSSGSTSLVDHMINVFSTLPENPRLVCVYRLGVGWAFAQDSDKARFKQITGLVQEQNAFSGLTPNEDEDALPSDPAGAIGLLDAAMRQQDQSVVCIIDRAELVCAQSAYGTMSAQDKAILSILQALASDRAVESTRNILILVTDSLIDLHESLRLASSRFYSIEIVPPDYEERYRIANQVFGELQAEYDCQVDLTPAQFAQATSMLTRYGIMDCLLDAKQSGSLTKNQVREVKAKVMSQEYGDILEALDPVEAGYSAFAGQEPLKAYFAELVQNMIDGNYSDVPAGVLLAGAAGLGKSYFMRTVAGQSGLPVINLNIGRILGSYVGQSERNLERALTAIRSAAPCLVVLDEIETTFPDRASAGPNGDSGVSSRILKRMLEELSNPSNRGKVVWVGITNFPQKLDAALSRAGRFDVTVAFLPPTLQERVDLVNLYCTKYGLTLPSATAGAELGKRSAGYTNAELENVTRKARQLCREKNDQAFVDLSLIDALARVRANTRDVDTMTVNALKAVNDADLLHPDYIDQWRKLTGQSEPTPQAPEKKRAGLF